MATDLEARSEGDKAAWGASCAGAATEFCGFALGSAGFALEAEGSLRFVSGTGADAGSGAAADIEETAVSFGVSLSPFPGIACHNRLKKEPLSDLAGSVLAAAIATVSADLAPAPCELAAAFVEICLAVRPLLAAATLAFFGLASSRTTSTGFCARASGRLA